MALKGLLIIYNINIKTMRTVKIKGLIFSGTEKEIKEAEKINKESLNFKFDKPNISKKEMNKVSFTIRSKKGGVLSLGKYGNVYFKDPSIDVAKLSITERNKRIVQFYNENCD